MYRSKRIFSSIFLFAFLLSIILIPSSTIKAAGNVDLTNPVFNFDKILFVKHDPLKLGHNHMVFQYFGFNAYPSANGGIYILNHCFSGNPTLTNVLENSICQSGNMMGKKLLPGSFLSPDLSYDGNQIVFAYTAKTSADSSKNYEVWNAYTTYKIFKVNIDGTGLTQLTNGSTNDFDPCWLPDGRIAFISEFRGGYGRCHGVGQIAPGYTLTTMNADGTDVRVISYHETNEWAPSVDNNGMIVYTRWDYVDRGATHTHSPWITTPDGLDARPICLNYTNSLTAPGGIDWRRNAPLMSTQLRAIPNSNKYVGIAAPHHEQSYGPVIVIDPDVEDDDFLSTITKITPDAKFPESETGLTDMKYGTPYPLSEDYLLCVYDPNANTNGIEKRYGIYALDRFGNKSLLYSDPTMSCLEPIPLRARPIPNAIPISKKPTGAAPDGIVTVANVYDTTIPFPEGTVITELRIWQIYPKSTPYASVPRISYEGAESGNAGRNTRGLIGSIPVDPDGSAAFYLPANKCFFFQAVTADGTAVQTMRSDAFVVGGQTRLDCQGCHEPRHSTPNNGDAMPTAYRRAPSVITPETSSGARPMSFPRLIQPVLNSKCISCHNGTQIPDLRQGSSNGYGWSASYVNLKPYVFLFDVYYKCDWDRVYPRTEPGKFGARMSSLYTKLAGGHGNLSDEELHRFAIWLDSGIAPFYGDYNNTAAQRNGDQVEPTLE